ncbi:CocE/NonD family hydrolase [Bacteroides faecalis]|uniref:CocE/NonD family hydrolase n=1 Tax=Bacteroides faecalis TaxID=2447885 RepID=UPI000F621C7B|nr:CocE/NonD family hydrolase [Bacteroides faecalis]
MTYYINKWSKVFCFVPLLYFLLIGDCLSAQEINEAWIKENYTKREEMIPMRDGIHLYTAIYEPVHQEKLSPILITRTPYKASPYGEKMNSRLWGTWQNYAREKYIFVIQDVRGRWKSEGEFVNVRPFIANKKKKKDIDEASDVYDTTEWLLHHTKKNNGNVGIIGSSYSGFYSIMGALSTHPAIKAAVPQAPVTDWFLGDDYHHNGAFMLCDGFRFAASMNRPRPVPTEESTPAKPYYQTDEYSFFLKAGALKNLTRLLGDSIAYWNDLMAHPNYDSWWQQRDTRRSCYNIRPAILVVGGLFDAEDCYGAWELYKAIHKQSPDTDLHLIVGPWYHGAWGGNDGSYLGNVRFGSKNVPYYQEQIEYPFLQYYLNGKGTPITDSRKVNIFFSGENQWKEFESWPNKKAQAVSYYLDEKGTLSTNTPNKTISYSEYVSDPAKPVPYTDKTTYARAKEYMTDDQRFAERRPDVLCFKTETLEQPLTVGGEVEVELEVTVTTTDADFVVKVIDEFPEDFAYNDQKDGKGSGYRYLMNGYQMLVRGDVMRGRYRNSFEHPEAFVPGQPTKVRFTMPDIAHTFQKGHRLVVQIQSTWFPLIDRNPQQFVNIYTCEDADFIKSTIQILHQKNNPSKITFRRLL